MTPRLLCDFYIVKNCVNSNWYVLVFLTVMKEKERRATNPIERKSNPFLLSLYRLKRTWRSTKHDWRKQLIL